MQLELAKQHAHIAVDRASRCDLQGIVGDRIQTLLALAKRLQVDLIDVSALCTFGLELQVVSMESLRFLRERKRIGQRQRRRPAIDSSDREVEDLREGERPRERLAKVAPLGRQLEVLHQPVVVQIDWQEMGGEVLPERGSRFDGVERCAFPDPPRGEEGVHLEGLRGWPGTLDFRLQRDEKSSQCGDVPPAPPPAYIDSN